MTTASSDISAWFSGRLPAEWTQHGPPTVVVDREEITVTLEIAAPDLADDTTDIGACRGGRRKNRRLP